MTPITELAARNQQRAREIIETIGIIHLWESIGAKINLVGSLKSGLLMKHRDIDFHIYSDPVRIADSFAAIAQLAAHPRIQRMEYVNLLDTEEACLEWHAWYLDADNEVWQIDMIHLQKGSRYDGYMEKVTDRISEVLTPETRQAILQLKYDTPDTEKIPGIAYYQAVIRDGVRDYTTFTGWLKEHPVEGVVEWMP